MPGRMPFLLTLKFVKRVKNCLRNGQYEAVDSMIPGY